MTKRLIVLGLLSSLILLVAGCEDSASTVVEVGDARLTTSDINELVDTLGQQGQQMASSPEGRRWLLESRVEEEIIYQAALAQGVDQLPDIQAQIEKTVRNIVISYFYRLTFSDMGFSENELRDYYEAHREELRTPDQAHVRTLTYQSAEEARRASARLQRGVEFSTLAAELTTDPDAGRQMILNDKSQNTPKNLLEAVFTAGPGEIVGPVETGMGHHIILVEHIRPGELMSFDQARPTIIERLLVSEADLLDWFNENRDSFDRPESARLRFILLEDEAKARAVLTELRRGADVAEMARRQSIDPVTAEHGGLIPALYHGTPAIRGFQQSEDIDRFIEAVFKLTPGELSDPLRLTRGYVIIKLEELTPAYTAEFDEVRDRVYKSLLNERLTERESAIIESLGESLGVTRNEELINAWIERGSFITLD